MRKVAVFLAWVLIGLCLVCCDNSPSNSSQYEEYVIRVDSIEIPDTISLHERFVVSFYGVLGNDASCRFSRVVEYQDSLCTSLMLIGRKAIGASNIDTIYLEKVQHSMRIDDSCRNSIVVLNPGYNNKISKFIVLE